ncbi:MAG TPA: hypothetical protein EYH32_04700 [Anaerolineae bacterium]|nr:hypothetical protein [Anaerolineae bacterium]
MRNFVLMTLLLLATAMPAPLHGVQGVAATATTYRPPAAFQMIWDPGGDRLEVDVYPDGYWQLAPDCYDWPASCWDIVGQRWSFRVAKGASGSWAVVASSGDYEPDEHGVEQALAQATLATLNTGEPGAFVVFEPGFDDCYIDLLMAVAQGEERAGDTWPEHPWDRCPW